MFVYRLLLLLVAVTAVEAEDERFLALALQAQSSFDRVETAPFPVLPDTIRCVQSQAEVLSLAKPADVPQFRFRKGYCTLLGATLTGNRAEYDEAARDFAQAVAAWDSRAPEPLSSGLQVLSAIARLRAGAEPQVLPDIRAGLEDAVARSVCSGTVMSRLDCSQLVEAGRLWLGWLDDRQGNLAEAAQHFRASSEAGWVSWEGARQAQAARRYSQAAEEFEKAVDAWTAEQKYPKPGIPRLLGPQPDLADAIYRLGAAEYLAGRYPEAVATLVKALKARPGDAGILFVRGLAKEAQGQAEPALADYQLASRTAFANPDAPHSAGEAHYYRGVWMYRRKDFTRAEDEFATALNQDPGAAVRPDVDAWRHLAAVATGTCGSEADRLATALRPASDFFPRREAEKLVQACREPLNSLSQK